MARQIYVNLPVRRLDAARDFFAALGFSFDPRYSDDTAACMVVSDGVHVMLLTEDRFRSFTPKPLCDARQATEVLLCLSCDGRDEVDALVRRAVAAGGSTYSEAQDHGFMYAHGFQDPDGHIWELVAMAPDGAP